MQSSSFPTTDKTYICEICHVNVPLMNQMIHKARCKMNSKELKEKTYTENDMTDTSPTIGSSSIVSSLTLHSTSPSSSTSTNSVSSQQQPIDQVITWACSKCTLINPTVNTNCDACGNSFSSTSTAHCTTTTSSASTTPSDEWACNMCTFCNSNTLELCSMCETPRTSEATATATATGLTSDRHNNVSQDGEPVISVMGPMFYSTVTPPVSSVSNLESQLQNLQSSTMMGALAGGALSTLLLQQRGGGGGSGSGQSGVLSSMLLGAGLGVLGGLVYNLVSSSSEQATAVQPCDPSQQSADESSARNSDNRSPRPIGIRYSRSSSSSSSISTNNRFVDLSDAGRVLINGTTIRTMSPFMHLDYGSVTDWHSLSDEEQEQESRTIEEFVSRLLTSNDHRNSNSNAKGLSVEQIQRLRTHIVTKSDITSESSGTCNICLDNFDLGQTVKCLPCVHKFHDKCIDRWLKISSSCPLCKHDISTESS